MPYKRTKLEAERLVLAAPAAPASTRRRRSATATARPTPTGAMIRGVATGRYRAYPRIGLNVVDVRDVARGHVLALEQAAPASGTCSAAST